MSVVAPKRHVLVAGGAGYIGSVLTRELLGAGLRVRVLDSLLYGNGESLAIVAEHERAVAEIEAHPGLFEDA